MVAVIKISKSLRNVLHYNENKIEKKVAKLIHSEGFAKDTETLTMWDKLKTFEKRNSLNERSESNMAHISLNFHAEDKLNEEKLKAIADAYMQKIGFGEQPYLVYQHFDAGHTHIHIAASLIRSDGTRIRTQNIGRNQSSDARIAIEKEFRLRSATATELKQAYELKPLNVPKVQYGRTETKRAITNVLDHVLPLYKYASLPELNAVLKLYNVMADTGSKESRIAKNGGLVYRVLNEQGEKVGVPIKASLIYNKPTLKSLQEKFTANKLLKEKYKQRIKNAIDYSIKRQADKISLKKLEEALKQESIRLVLRQNTEGRIYGLTFVDMQQKCVFNGSDLGKQYSAAAVLQRLENPTLKQDEQKFKQQQNVTADNKAKTLQNNKPKEGKGIEEDIFNKETNIAADNSIQKAIDILFKEEYNGSLAIELQTELKRRRRKKLRQ